MIVDDLDAQLAALAERGLTTDPVETMDNGVRTAEIRDADGNLIKFGQPPEEEATP
jgi:catechol 2,3-dioxygenase-like lactoylglutathione lyase family enzyme